MIICKCDQSCKLSTNVKPLIGQRTAIKTKLAKPRDHLKKIEHDENLKKTYK